MCGFAGIVDLDAARSADELRARVEAMGSTLAHRGPDDAGTWIDASAGIALAFRRLSIIDLSAAGHQPMQTADGRITLVFNGEIYNHHEVRGELETHGVRFRGRSDTEVLLEAIRLWGVRRTLERLNGMFAVAVWDADMRTLFFARDRMGEKPLYIGTSGGIVAFGSEMKAVERSGLDLTVDRDVLATYLRLGYVAGSASIYRGVERVMPGELRWVNLHDRIWHKERYWSAIDAAAAPRRSASLNEAADELEAVLLDAVGSRMEADVPLGAFLSGGIDSSTVVALMSQLGAGTVRTFAIGFDEPGFNEADHAKAVASHLGTDHSELYITAKDCLDVVPTLPSMFDEPFADPSAVPTALVARLARRDVTVVLSGDGGDELFGGYERYLWARDIWRRLRPVPLPLRRAVAGAVRGVPIRYWDRVLKTIPRALRGPLSGERLHRVGELALSDSAARVYAGIVSQWKHPHDVVLGAVARPTALEEEPLAGLRDVEGFQLADQLSYLPDDILVKVDRATMAVGLEARVPLLDPRVVDFAWSLRPELNINKQQGKQVLREVLYRHVPRDLVDRPKTGFGIPIDEWLRGPLRTWAGDLLSPERLSREGFFDPVAIEQVWSQHRSGVRDRGYLLWSVLMFEAWLDRSQ